MLGWWQAVDTSIRMFAELLGGLDEAAEVYAAEADRRRVAGLACEAAYTDAQGRYCCATWKRRLRPEDGSAGVKRDDV
ncbi:MAG TPA: hypothetical protein DEO64_08830 [Alcaligenes faecalis]|nr:hypothetical protein [Alcaligenes faecalis]